MDAARIAGMIIQYQRYKSMCDPARFISTLWFQEGFPEMYAMSSAGAPVPLSERFGTLIETSNMTQALQYVLDNREEDIPWNMLGTDRLSVEALLKELNPLKNNVPGRTVVLTFDDARRDHFTHAAPVLKRLGFGATFFVTEPEAGPMGSGFEDKSRFMDWSQIRELEQMGFEIGNHTLHHRKPEEPFDPETFRREIEGLNERAVSHGIKRPVSFAYAFGGCTPEQMAVAVQCGMEWGRGNVDAGVCRTRGKMAYDPLCDDPLSIPSFGDAPLYSLKRLEERVDLARDGKVLCLAFHSVTDPVEWGCAGIGFENYMQHLKDLGCRVIGLNQLREYIDPVIARHRFCL